MKVRRSRAELFGALVVTEDPPALVAVDRILARRLGVQGGALWRAPSQPPEVAPLRGPTEVHLAVTARCPVGCKSCYADAAPGGHEPPQRALRARLEGIAEAGAFTVAFGGGEPALRPDLGALARHALAVGLTPTLTTSGLGIDAERATELAAFAQVNVSYDGPDETYVQVRGHDGARGAEGAIGCLAAAGVPVGVNTLLTTQSFERVEATAQRAEDLGAVEMQLLRLKPTGRAGPRYLAQRLTPAQVSALPALLRRLSVTRRLAVRIDCAMVPLVVHDGTIDPAELSRFAVMGCEGGRSFMTLDARGGAHPCSFFRAPTEGPARDAADAYRDDPTLARFRAHGAAPPEPCAGCSYLSSCRGGCRVIAGHQAGTPWAPDPECPRVRRHDP